MADQSNRLIGLALVKNIESSSYTLNYNTTEYNFFFKIISRQGEKMVLKSNIAKEGGQYDE